MVTCKTSRGDVFIVIVLVASSIVACLLAFLSALHLFGVDSRVVHEKGQTLGRALISLWFHLNWYEGQTHGRRSGMCCGRCRLKKFLFLFPILCLLLPRRFLVLVYWF